MAQVLREAMLESLHRGETIVVFDGERIEIAPEHVASVHVVVQDLVAVP
jgi:L-asparaginase II